ncbi:hypothetical protein [Streptomyces sp. R44]|uniref:Transposase n=1 Tax=Streptomyces sp. R44 TaxID=3238633 RepID=A0AB39T7F3_9ACTN
MRKAMFIALLKDGTGVAALGEHLTRRWREAMADRQQDRMVLFDEAAKVLALAVRDWAGLPLSDAAAAGLARDCTSMVDGFATPGPRHLRARQARRRQEQALPDLITDVRRAPEADSKGSALKTVAWHRDLDKTLLGPRIAAVELMNIMPRSPSPGSRRSPPTHCTGGPSTAICCAPTPQAPTPRRSPTKYGASIPSLPSWRASPHKT